MILSIFTLYLWIFIRIVEKIAMFKMVKPEELTEGDWIVNEIKIGKKVIYSPKDLGVDTKQIKQLIRLKKQGKIESVVVSGCMVERYKDTLLPELKEVDAFIDVGSLEKIVDVIKKIPKAKSAVKAFGSPNFLYDDTLTRVQLTPSYFAYVKISEGCAHHCSYCVIPSIRGKYRSRKIDSILREVVFLDKQCLPKT